jgi:hypothetical protein
MSLLLNLSTDCIVLPIELSALSLVNLSWFLHLVDRVITLAGVKMANLVIDLDEGVDLTFDSIYWMNENFEEQSYLIREDSFNTAQIMYLSVLSAVEKVYGKLSSSRAKNLLTSAIANRMEEVGNWIIDAEKNDGRGEQQRLFELSGVGLRRSCRSGPDG